ncbi:uncharacterized protein LOC124666134 isoform X1 [Lolium rigidum]|uniref:uncharacterized protein LOC124666134 isoform X1 n=1 Tax=Lolium rigidum TaxID=89674 RepID=UPI001F5C1D51|nr:uncharacterized protein LOC124666134 isoform X1 [Lolium rigidum]
MDGDAKGPGVISSPWSSGGKGHWRSGIIYPSPDQNQSKLLQFMVVHYFDVLAGTDVVGSITVHSNGALLINVENNGCSTQVRRDVEAKGKGIFSVETQPTAALFT